jgi:alpha-L-fucosidase
MELRTLIDTKPTLRESIARGHTAKASNVFHGQSQWGPEKALDGDFGSRWAADDDQKSGWLEVDLGAERTIGSVFVSEAYNRVHAFQVEVPDGTGWKPIARANTIGEDGVDLDFAPVKASRIRLNITDAPGGPTIWEFQVFSP